MSKGKQPTPTSAAASAPSGPLTLQANVSRPCVVLVGGPNGHFFGGKTLGLNSDIATTLVACRAPDTNPWLGFSIDFPLGESNEDEGFGMTHMVVREAVARPKPTNVLRLKIKLPRGQIDTSFENLDEATRAKFPKVKSFMSKVNVHIRDGGKVDVEGFGMPFENPKHAAQEWLRHPDTAPVVGDKSLLDIILQVEFTFIVQHPHGVLEGKWDYERLPCVFDYGFGVNHSWNLDKHMAQLHLNKGRQFAPAWSFDDDNMHLAAVTQSQVQDVMWLHEVTVTMRAEEHLAYFVSKPATLNQTTRLFAIVQLDGTCWERFDAAWSRLTCGRAVRLMMHDTPEDIEGGEVWVARILNHPDCIEALSQHPRDANDLVLENRVSLDFDCQLKEFERKVNAVCDFHPAAAPTNPVVWGIADPKVAQDSEKQKQLEPVPHQVKLLMSLHRDLMRGQGFWKTMVDGIGNVNRLDAATERVTLQDHEAAKPLVRMRLGALPSHNLLTGPNEEWVDCLMMEALAIDRARFRRYLSQRPLGFGLIIAGPGFGKTTALALATLGMAASVGKVFGSGPTHVAVDNFAARLDAVTCRVTERYNEGKEAPLHQRRALIVRAYKTKDEFAAFMKLLKNPSVGDEAAPRGLWGLQSKWKLHLSPSFWLLVCLGSSGVRSLHDDDSKALHDLRDHIAEREDLSRFRAVGAGEITWEEYANGETATEGEIVALLSRLIEKADILCTLPALAFNESPLSSWKNKLARGIAVDEAANMNRPDLCSVWGNTLLPCLLAGDEKQFGPVVNTLSYKDSEGNAVNRLGEDGRISPLEFFKGSGWPIYRLRTQLRMAVGQFELCKTTVYRDVASTYGAGAEISLPAHSLGQVFEEYIQHMFPKLKPAPPGTLQPLFVHCKGSYCIVDPVTHSKRNPAQVKIALGFLCDFIKAKQVDPAKVLIISPYAAMVDFIERMRKKREYEALKGMRPASTVDSIQGQEGDMVVVITGTTRKSGPGFTMDEGRLSVMLSRHKSALVIFGDLHVAGPVEKSKGKKRKRGKEPVAIQVVTREGEVAFVKPSMLRKVHTMLFEAERVATIEVEWKGKGKDKVE
ncbi:hypothetical protein ACJ41O_013741 [Fusarium nematophilum]